MNWTIYALAAIAVVGFSDLFRKLGSGLKDPFFANFIFQAASFATATLMFLLFSRTIEKATRPAMFAIIGGTLISIFTMLSFKALSTGPGVGVVMPVLRIGGILLIVVLGIIFLKEKLTIQGEGEP